MISETFSVSPTNSEAILTSYLWEPSLQQSPDNRWQPELRPAVIICPGGAYVFLSDREAEPVAMQFYAKGLQVFVLRYSILEESRYPNPLEEASRAIWLVRSHAKEWGIDEQKIIFGGFSAGGHLTSLIGTRWNEPGLAERLRIPVEGNKPNGLILCYAKFEPIDETLIDLVTPEQLGHMLRVYDQRADGIKNVSSFTPPSFIWHTVQDETVPVDESLRFALKCQQEQVPFELHAYAEGEHGLSLSNDLSDYRKYHPVNVEGWVTLCVNWFKHILDF